MSENDASGLIGWIKRLIDWLERYPAAWFLIGLLVVWHSTGGLLSGLGDLPHLQPPESLSVRGFLFALGGTAAVLAMVYLVATSTQVSPESARRYIGAPLLLIVLFTAGSFIWAEFNKRHAPIVLNNDFNLTTRRYTLTLRGDQIWKHANKKVVMFVRPERENSFDTDQDVIFGAVGQVSASEYAPRFSLQVSTEFLEPLKIGQWLECQLVFLPKDANLTDAKTVADSVKKGGVKLFPNQTDGNRLSIDDLTPEWIAVLAQKLRDEQMEALKKSHEALKAIRAVHPR